MASKSTGQIIGTVGGAVIGFFAGGNIALGAAIGGAIGGLIDPPKGPTIVGPRLDDLSFQTSTLGAPLGRAYGTVPVFGNVVWLEGDAYREVITSEEQGGKGGSSATYETARYYATFAVSLMRITDATKTVALRRMWIGSNLVYDAGSDDLESIIASNSQSALFTFYSGSDDQQPNTRWQADKGSNAVSGFPGRCYIVIYDLDLEPYSRSLAMAQIKCELSVGSPTYQIESAGTLQAYNPEGWSPTISRLKGEVYSNGKLTSCFCFDNSWDGAVYGSTFGEMEIGVSQKFLSSISTPLAGSGYLHVAPYQIRLTQTDSLAIVLLEDMQNYGEVLRLHINEDIGTNFQINAFTQKRLGVYDSGDLYVFGNGSTSTALCKINLAGEVWTSAGSYVSESGGASLNYIFLTAYTIGDTGTQTIYKLSRVDLSLVDTYTASSHSNKTVISVESDSVFYTISQSYGIVYKWVDGVIVDSKSSLVPVGDVVSFKVYSFDPPYVVTTLSDGSVYIGHGVVSQSVAYLRDVVTSECGLAGIGTGDIDLSALTNSTVRGYRVSNAGSIRSSLEMLQAAYPFDVAPSGYDLRFVSRGGSSLVTIPETDLGATAGGDSLPALLPVSREMDTQIPYKVSVRYLDPAREYDIAEQYASRPDTASVNERTVELSLVLTGDEATQVADVLNQKDWLERVSFGTFTLPPTYRAIEPPDVITVEHRGQSYLVRLTRAEFLPDGRIECAGVYSSAQSYTSTASAQESLTIGQSLVPLAGTTTGYLLDIPRIRSDQDVPGMAFGMTGLASGWPGGVVLRSDDSGNSWQSIGAMNLRAHVFTTEDVAGAHHGYSIDHAPVLTVTPIYSAHTLSSLTENQLYAHANLAAYGADGRWEIVAFKSVTDNTGSYTLKDFLRGLYGTEWATGLHVAGDLLVLLDTSTVGFFGLPINTLGSPRAYRFVTQGASIDSSLDFIDTYDGNNLKPLSPVDARADRQVDTRDWILSVTRRSRWPVELFSGVVVPLGESAEGYVVDICNSDYSLIIRTLTTSTGSATYTRTMQVEDFGVEQISLSVRWRQTSSVAGYGLPLDSSITLNISSDVYGPYVVAVSNMSDTGLSDIKGHAVTIYGNAARAVADVGGYWADLDANGDYLSLAYSSDMSLISGDFTIEAFIEIDAFSSADMQILSKDGVSGSSYSQYGIMITSGGKLKGVLGNGNGLSPTETTYTGTTTISIGSVNHVAMVVSGSNCAGYYNGVREWNLSKGAMYEGSKPLLVGWRQGEAVAQYFNGKVKGYRITKYARYTGPTYSVPPFEFPDPI